MTDAIKLAEAASALRDQEKLTGQSYLGKRADALEAALSRRPVDVGLVEQMVGLGREVSTIRAFCPGGGSYLKGWVEACDRVLQMLGQPGE